MTDPHFAEAASIQESPWSWWREQMPIARRWAYFDHAAVAPLPVTAQRRMAEFAVDAAENGTTSWPQWARKIEDFRQGVASWIHASSDEICLIPNTSSGVNLVAEGFPWESGDNVVYVASDFPSNRFPWENQASKGVELRPLVTDTGRIDVDAVDSLIDARTRIVAVSWVGYASGFRVDLDALVDLVHRRGALLFVDAIQGMGIYPIDVHATPIDFMAADGHKWMLGPEGAGFAYIRSEHLDRLRCTNVGWHSVAEAYDFKNAEFRLRNAASRFEAGSANTAGLLCLAESAAMFWQVSAEHGPEAIPRRVLELAQRTVERLNKSGAQVLTAWPDPHRSSILVFNVPGVSPSKVRSVGLERNVVLSCRGGGVRASIHVYNNDHDIDRLIEVVVESQA